MTRTDGITRQKVGRSKSFSNTRRGEETSQLTCIRSWNRHGIFRNRKTGMNIMATYACMRRYRRGKHSWKTKKCGVNIRSIASVLRAGRVNVTESSDDDQIALIDVAVSDLDVEPVREQGSGDLEKGTNIGSERPVSPCLSIRASDSWVMIGDKTEEERGGESLGPEDVKVYAEVGISLRTEPDTLRKEEDREEKLHRTKIINRKNYIQRESGYTERMGSLKDSTLNAKNKRV
ncbi:hypothetical protein J6590_088154 [Homalodisca vitripennis]|nr:hypothetical protein J6590_088154 [Homalodisca vitripennis]